MIEKKKIIMAIIFILGFLIFLYPVASNIAHSTSQASAIRSYNKELKKLDEKQKEKELEEAKKYNESLINAEIKVKDPYEKDGTAIKKEDKEASYYESPINIKNIIGSIEIPRIGINIPIYKGTSELVLQKGVGHLEGSSLPIGGLGTHTALTAHRGLPSSRLFRNLDKLEIGDEFYIHRGDITTAYKVDNINTVLPYETENIEIRKDKDYATLITCEPYMINTHRLLVRGTRTDYTSIKENEIVTNNIASQQKVSFYYKYKDFIILFIALILIILVFIKNKYFSKKKLRREVL